jgi:hypothetical protein
MEKIKIELDLTNKQIETCIQVLFDIYVLPSLNQVSEMNYECPNEDEDDEDEENECEDNIANKALSDIIIKLTKERNQAVEDYNQIARQTGMFRDCS